MDSYGAPGEFFYDEDRLGMSVTSGLCTLEKDTNNLVGISIGGGSPLCPCLYVVQIFDNTPAARDGNLEAGDEITGINKISVKGKSKTEVARMIQSHSGECCVQYNKLHADPKEGKTLDIVLKKMKHAWVEKISADTADALGMSRAILCNDSMVKKLAELESSSVMYKQLIGHVKKVWRSYYNINKAQRAFGDIFASIGAREQTQSASEAFTVFGEAHRNMEKQGMKMLRVLHPMVSDLNTFLNQAIPDTRLTVKKYLDAKFEYLSYCLKLKEMDDEEAQFAAMQEPLYRVETGNYEYRLTLRCRSDARTRFAKLRQDVLVKMELLDQKHAQDIVFQLQRFVMLMARYHTDSKAVLEPTRNLFPIEVDLSQVSVKYNATGQLPPDEDEEDDDGDDVPQQFVEQVKGEERKVEQHVQQLMDDMGDMSMKSNVGNGSSALLDLFDTTSQSVGAASSAMSATQAASKKDNDDSLLDLS